MPILGNLIPRTGFKGMYREALWAHNDWIMEHCNENPDVLYVDFYSSGKQNIPAVPLEDPNEPGAMNPIFDGDTQYDEHNRPIVIGNGIHPNVAGKLKALVVKQFATENRFNCWQYLKLHTTI